MTTCPACAEQIDDGLSQCPFCKTPIAPPAPDPPAAMPPSGVFFVGAALVLGGLSVLGMSQVNGGAVLVGLACLCGIFARIIQAGVKHRREIKRR